MSSDDFAQAAADAWHQIHPDERTDALVVATRIQRAATLIGERLERALAGMGLGALGDYEALAALRRSPHGLTPGELATMLLVSGAGITGRLARLEAPGWIQKEPHATDGRSFVVSLTETGRRVADEAFAAVQAERARVVEPLGPDEVAELAETLRTLLVHLGDAPPPP